MTAAQIILAMREATDRHERRERFRDQHDYLQTKQGYCREMRRLLAELMRRQGVDNPRGAIRSGVVAARGRQIEVETRVRRRRQAA